MSEEIKIRTIRKGGETIEYDIYSIDFLVQEINDDKYPKAKYLHRIEIKSNEVLTVRELVNSVEIKNVICIEQKK